jgi:hypothetical protein
MSVDYLKDQNLDIKRKKKKTGQSDDLKINEIG